MTVEQQSNLGYHLITSTKTFNKNLSMNLYVKGEVRVMVFNTTFNNISVKSRRSVFLVEETEVPGEKQRPATSH